MEDLEKDETHRMGFILSIDETHRMRFIPLFDSDVRDLLPHVYGCRTINALHLRDEDH